MTEVEVQKCAWKKLLRIYPTIARRISLAESVFDEVVDSKCLLKCLTTTDVFVIFVNVSKSYDAVVRPSVFDARRKRTILKIILN